MDIKDIQYLFEGIASTVGQFYDDVYDTLVVKGKKRMGQETNKDSPQISELIRRTREQQTVAEIIAKGKKGQEELIQSIGAQVKKILSSKGIVTHTDLARIQKRMDQIEKTLSEQNK